MLTLILSLASNFNSPQLFNENNKNIAKFSGQGFRRVKTRAK